MDYLNEFDDDQIKMLNGRYLMTAIASLDYEATENELLRHINATDHPQKVVKEELKRILNYGVTNGFIMKKDDKYLLPRLTHVCQVDGDGCGDESGKKSEVDEAKAKQKEAMTLRLEETEANSDEVVVEYSFLETARSLFCRNRMPTVMTAEIYPSECLTPGKYVKRSRIESCDAEEEDESHEFETVTPGKYVKRRKRGNSESCDAEEEDESRGCETGTPGKYVKRRNSESSESSHAEEEGAGC